MNKHINPKYKDAILRALEYHFPNAKIILFGSRARATHKEGADVDVAVDTGERILLREIQRARVTLENLSIPLIVDVVDFHNIPPLLQETIIDEGIIWKNSNSSGK